MQFRNVRICLHFAAVVNVSHLVWAELLNIDAYSSGAEKTIGGVDSGMVVNFFTFTMCTNEVSCWWKSLGLVYCWWLGSIVCRTFWCQIHIICCINLLSSDNHFQFSWVWCEPFFFVTRYVMKIDIIWTVNILVIFIIFFIYCIWFFLGGDSFDLQIYNQHFILILIFSCVRLIFGNLFGNLFSPSLNDLVRSGESVINVM